VDETGLAALPVGVYAETENEAELRRGEWRRATRVLAINASPRGRRGATEMVCSPLLAGMERAGATVERHYLSKLQVKPCRGCMICWTRRPGECLLHDDLEELLPTLPSYDLMVLGTPLYADGMTGLMKTFLERSIPLIHPAVYVEEGRCRHPSRHPRLPALVLASVCGFYEIENFDLLVQHVAAIGHNAHIPLVATVLRPTSMVLSAPALAGAVAQLTAALEAAGEELVLSGGISAAHQEAISRPLMPRERYLEGTRGWWEGAEQRKR
jgi:multimeric flavodoxin WrbA